MHKAIPDEATLHGSAHPAEARAELPEANHLFQRRGQGRAERENGQRAKQPGSGLPDANSLQPIPSAAGSHRAVAVCPGIGNAARGSSQGVCAQNV